MEFYPNDITPNMTAEKPWTLSIAFKENTEQTDNAYTVDHYKLEVEYYPELFNTTAQSGIYIRNPDAEVEWHGEKTIGFTCSKSGLALTNDSSIVFEHLKLVAFGMFESSNFTDTQGFEQCKLDIRTSDLVPIVVGACLAGLVIIVLIAYLIGRQRARRQGYASV
uniref:Lysosome-associated membrane glycoprotein 1 n=1 Tax=Panagrolaimus sp. JU765 TaxID=591449 RepID=A0AC34R2D5_9BILA